MNIEKSKYQGYIWYSNENKPRVFDGKELFELELKDGENPFVVEGFLCDGKKSISIKFVDGRYIVNTYNLNALLQDKELYDERELRFADSKNLKEVLLFRYYWHAEKDDLCDGMEVLQPAEVVFMGFTEK